MEDINLEDYDIYIKTIQSSPFRCLIEALKEILTDANIEIDSSGIKIVAIDTSHTVLVHLKLDASNFEIFHCKEKRQLGINMLNFYKFIKIISNNDTLSLYIDKQNYNNLGIKVENGDKNSLTKFSLKLLDITDDKISIPAIEFESVITMSSSDFQKLCRDMNNIGDKMEITSIDNILKFKVEGDIGTAEHLLGQDLKNNLTINSNKSNSIIQGIFNLKNLVMFTKCTNLCNQIKIFIKNDYPLIIIYDVASLGEIKLCLAPISINN
tara:strand:+ start:853 stop:1653 length:801 start_codon:yes stop_codon:yes gene_type:complete